MIPFLIAVLFALTSSLQPAGLSGWVVDSLGGALPDAVVVLESSGQRVAEVRTASDGRFEFSNDDAAAMRLVVTAPGFGKVCDCARRRRDARSSHHPRPGPIL